MLNLVELNLKTVAPLSGIEYQFNSSLNKSSEVSFLNLFGKI